MLTSKFASLCCGVCFVMVGLMSPTNVSAHPFHVCVGQMTWNAEAKHWEVSLRLHPQDLERSMKVRRTSSLSPDSTPGLLQVEMGG